MTSVVLSTSGIKIGRKRPVDADHAIEVLDHLRRGYTLSIRDPESPWSIGMYYAKSHHGKPVFVNQPEGTMDAVIAHVYYWNDKAVLYDHPFPQWVNDFLRHLKRVLPDDIHISTHQSIEGEEDERDAQDNPGQSD